ncbi:hypothetical protein HY251_12220, partial [bacterium]|nr:hypothetical protein [bacterium]
KTLEERKSLDSFAADAVAERDQLRSQLSEKERAYDELVSKSTVPPEERESGGEARALSSRLQEVQREKAELEEKLASLSKQHQEHVAASKEQSKQVESHTRRLGEVEREKADLAARAREHEARAKEHAAKLAELEKKLVLAKADVADDESEARLAAKGDTGGLVARVRALERDKAEILLESKREIERLTREQDALREELESAGEMIERLGKELELT